MEPAVEQFERDGYCIADEQVAPDDVLEKALRGMAAVRDGSFDTGLPPTSHPGCDPGVLCKIDNPHRSDTGLHGLVTCPRVGRRVTAWIALCDVGPAAGPMLFVRGSHRWGFLDRGDFFDKDQHRLREEIAVPAGETWEEVAAVMPMGGLSVHHCLTYHGSNANLSDTARWSLAVHLRDERALPVPGDQGYYTAHLEDPRICPVMYEA